MNEQSIFLAALDFNDPAERSAYLIKACAGNTTLLQNVKALLASHEKSGDFLDMPAVKQILDDPFATQELGFSSREEVDLSYLSPSTKPDSLGTLAHYEIRQVLGQGGFGTVLKAFDEKLHRLVAIKVLSRELAATSPPRKRFLREARSVAAIKHENVIAIYSVEEQPLPYIVMEFVDGGTLQDKRDEFGPFPVSEILSMGKQIASGLAAAHAMGLIHRDIKPANILLEKGVVQKVKITDFGLARAADDASMTQSGVIAGTPLYMAPEQARGSKLDARTDLFSLGSVLYALATGHPPFRAPDTLAVLRRVTEDTPRPMQEVISDIPDWFVAIVDKLLAKEPGDRFQTAQEVADALAQCQSELQAGVPVTAEENLGVKRPTPSGPILKAVPKQNTFPVAGVAAGVVLMFTMMAAGLFFFTQSKKNGAVAVSPASPDVPTSSTTTTDSDRASAEQMNTKAGVLQNSQSPAESERALAEWLIKQPGVRLLVLYREDGSSAATSLKTGDTLPIGEFFVHQFDWIEADAITDDDLARIGNALRLNTIFLRAKGGKLPNVTDQGLGNLFSPSVSKSLRQIQLHATLPKVSEDGYLLINRPKNLSDLAFYVIQPAKGAFLSQLHLPSLQNLVVDGNETPGGCLESLTSRSPNLENIYLAGCQLNQLDLRALTRLVGLSYLSLDQCSLTNESLDVIGKLSELHELHLGGNPEITDKGTMKLKSLKRLKNAGLGGCNVGDETCRTLASLDKLEWISLGSTRITDNGIEAITSLKSVRFLNLVLCKRLTDEGIDSIAKISSLTELYIQNNAQLTEPAIQKLRTALPKCKILSDFGTFEPTLN